MVLKLEEDCFLRVIPVPPVAVSTISKPVPPASAPCMVSFDPGLVVPTPTFPPFVTTKEVLEEEPITKAGFVPRDAVGLMENSPQGEVEPILVVFDT